MRHIEIRRSGDARLSFEGELLASRSSRLLAEAETTRWHEIEIYRTDRGKYVVHLGWRTRWSGEPPEDVALVVESLQEAQNAVRAIIPAIEPLAGYPVGGYLDKRRSRIERDAMTRFDAAVSALFRGVRAPERPRAPRRVHHKCAAEPALAE